MAELQGTLSVSPAAGDSAIRDAQEDLRPITADRRKPPGLRLAEWLALSAFSAIVASGIAHHEPWADEAQAWQLARSLPLGSLFRSYIRYEATPGLWHFVLWILIRLHVGYSAMHWVCGIVAVAASALLIFRSPLPLYLRVTLPFTYFLVFQYAVIARSYVLAPLLLFLVAIQWKKSPALVAILLGLLGNVSLHAAVISGGLAIVYGIEWMRIQKDDEIAVERRRILIFALILVCFYAFAIWTAWPPHDLSIARFRGQSRPFLIFALGSLVYGICQPWILSVPFWIAIGLSLRARRALVYLLPVAFFALFSGFVYAQFWHLGLLVPLVISLMWITWPAHAGSSRTFESAGRCALVVMAAVQIAWAVFALAWDHSHAFSGDPAAARFLEPLVRDNARILVTWSDVSDAHAFDAVGILPYFSRNIYENQEQPFWWWSENNPIKNRFEELLPTHPRIVLVETRLQPNETLNVNRPEFERIRREGYRLTNSFCGTMPVRLEPGLSSCHLIFQRVDEAATRRDK